MERRSRWCSSSAVGLASPSPRPQAVHRHRAPPCSATPRSAPADPLSRCDPFACDSPRHRNTCRRKTDGNRAARHAVPTPHKYLHGQNVERQTNVRECVDRTKQYRMLSGYSRSVVEVELMFTGTVTRALSSLIFPAARFDVLRVAVPAVIVVAAGVGAALPAALRAARTDPM